MSDAIALAEANPAWPMLYTAARDEILQCLPAPPVLIEHIGSTAVPGLSAKPIIDIIVLVETMAPVLEALPALERIGYEFRPDVSSQTRLFLRRRGDDGERSHHLHIHTDSGEVRRHIIFRDCLHADKSLQHDYLVLKQRLAATHPDDREAYARGKNDFVDAVVEAAGGPARRPFWNP